MDAKQLEWARKLQAISQTGLAYTKEPYEIERFEAVGEIAAEMMSHLFDWDMERFHHVFKSQYGYATPKVDVRGVAFRGGKILMVKERIDGKWTVPGGWADVCDSPRECVEREVREESGFQAKAIKLAALFDRDVHGHQPPYPFHIYKHFILCDLVGGEAKASYETLDVGFFAEEELPPLSTSRVTAHQIGRMFEHHRNPDLPVDFD